jgi:dihydroxy-acid dehydratase
LEAALGGPIAFVEDGDEILIDAENNVLELLVDQSIIDERLTHWVQPKPNYTKGVLAKFAKLAKSASEGAVTD